MPIDAPPVSLTTTSYLVLGMVRDGGALTPYELKAWVAGSVGNFWSFPHSQLYAEPAKLAAAGLLDEHQEEGGRRRKTYRITEQGRAALEAWLDEPVRSGAEMRDSALLQLFFASDADQIRAIAAAQVAVHAAQVDAYEELKGRITGVASPAQRATLEMGLRYERMLLQFWSEVETEPPAGGRPDARLSSHA